MVLEISADTSFRLSRQLDDAMTVIQCLQHCSTFIPMCSSAFTPFRLLQSFAYYPLSLAITKLQFPCTKQPTMDEALSLSTAATYLQRIIIVGNAWTHEERYGEWYYLTRAFIFISENTQWNSTRKICLSYIHPSFALFLSFINKRHAHSQRRNQNTCTDF